MEETTINETTEITPKSNRGRKPITINFPQGQFTVKDVDDKINYPNRIISSVAIQMKINKAVKDAFLKIVGKEAKTGAGRKAFIYSLNEQAS